MAALTATPPRIGLALSGGGFRAVAFGLGALRALHDRRLLDQVSVVSGVSGGSLLAALYAYGPSDFAGFDAAVTKMLGQGLQLDVAKQALQPLALASSVTSAVAATSSGRSAPMLRGATRTDALSRILRHRYFGDRVLSAVNRDSLSVVINATDLRTGTSFRFGSDVTASSRYGRVLDTVTVAEAVATSAAFPAFFPAVERRYKFVDFSGATSTQDVALADGGIYDNLGLSVLEPGRSARFTAHVYELDYIIAVDAGQGRAVVTNPRYIFRRLHRSGDIIHRRNQDSGRARLHDAAANGRLNGFVHAYLGMHDGRLPIPVPGLVARDFVESTGTSFRKMAPEVMEVLTLRSEQLTRALLRYYLPDLR